MSCCLTKYCFFSPLNCFDADTEGQNIVLSAKYSLINYAKEIPSDLSQIHPLSVVNVRIILFSLMPVLLIVSLLFNWYTCTHTYMCLCLYTGTHVTYMDTYIITFLCLSVDSMWLLITWFCILHWLKTGICLQDNWKWLLCSFSWPFDWILSER